MEYCSASLITSLRARPGPALTWYGDSRTELSGRVASMWITKIVNLLTGELSADTFSCASFPGEEGGSVATDSGGTASPRDGDSAPPPPSGRIRIDLAPSWQAVLWTASAWLTGWQTLPSTDGPVEPEGASFEADVLVTSEPTDEAAQACDAGTWVLVQSLDPLAMRWPGTTLPPGMLDALSDVMAQSDFLETFPSPATDTVVDAASCLRIRDITDKLLSEIPQSLEDSATARSSLDGREHQLTQRVAVISHSITQDTLRLLSLWSAGVSAVVVDPRYHNDVALAKVLEQERISLTQTIRGE